jgi:ribosome recycling factor
MAAIIDSVRQEAKQRMEKSVEALKKDFSHVRTGRATPSLLDGIKVEYYGAIMPVNQVATISVPEARLILIQPWEKTMLPVIEKAIKASDLGLNPQNDGNMIRVPIPALSEERRKELVKHSKKISEDNKIAVRNIRRDANDRLKKAEKDKEITQDESKKSQEEIQKLTDAKIADIDKLLEAKEKEILET